MANRFLGTLEVDFETYEDVSEEKFKAFKKKYDKMLEEWDMMLNDLAEESGFEIQSIWSINEDYELQAEQ